MNPAPMIPNDASQDFVPAELPGMRADVPEAVRPPNFAFLPFATLGYWFAPKRFGVRLAAAGWIPAVIAALTGLIVGASLVSYALIEMSSETYGVPGVFAYKVDQPTTRMTTAELLRSPFAAMIVLIHALTAPAALGVRATALLVGLPVSVVLLLTLGLMPFVASGECLAPLLGRCLRLVLWSMTLLILFGIGWMLFPLLLEAWGVVAELPEGFLHGVHFEQSDPTRPYVVTAICLFIGWWLVILLRGGARYAGPPDGPGWKPRTPRCVRCRYIISGIALDSMCPECGTPVAESLRIISQHRRFTPWNAFKQAIRDAVDGLRSG